MNTSRKRNGRAVIAVQVKAPPAKKKKEANRKAEPLPKAKKATGNKAQQQWLKELEQQKTEKENEGENLGRAQTAEIVL